MNKEIRPLTIQDYSKYKEMRTGMEQDYILYVFPRLVKEENRLFGLFIDDSLVSVAGYSIHASQYAMLGRLRSDERYRGKSFGTEILRYAKKQAENDPRVHWIGGNTEEHNKAARKVLEKIQFPPLITLHAAQTSDLSVLVDEVESWEPITSLTRKKEWINQTYLNDQFDRSIFPYEAYYPFPVSESLFSDSNLDAWKFYENKEGSRFIILWQEKKKHPYLHVTYPWKDFQEQEGFWETIHKAFQIVKDEIDEPVYVWIDLTKEEAKELPNHHPFELPSPWMLHGKWLVDSLDKEESLETSLEEANESMEKLERELKEIDSELENKTEKTKKMQNKIDEYKD